MGEAAGGFRPLSAVGGGHCNRSLSIQDENSGSAPRAEAPRPGNGDAKHLAGPAKHPDSLEPKGSRFPRMSRFREVSGVGTTDVHGPSGRAGNVMGFVLFSARVAPFLGSNPEGGLTMVMKGASNGCFA